VTVTDGIAEVDVGAARLTVAADTRPGERVLIGCRPEDLTLAPANAGGPTSAQNRLDGCIVGLAPLGPLWRVGVDCGVSLTALVTRPAVETLALAPGVRVSVSVKATALHLVRRGPGAPS
jgi:molybdopterin-binding protein